MVFIAARLTSATSSGDACSKGGGRPTRFAAGDDTAAGASRGCRWSTSIASLSDSANPATGTCTSRSPTDTGTVSEVMSLPCPDALGIVSTSIGSGVGLTVLMLRLRLRLPLLLSELTVPERPWNSDAACASAVSWTLPSLRFRISRRTPSRTASTAMKPPVRPTPAEQCSRTGAFRWARRATPVRGSTSSMLRPRPDTTVLPCRGGDTILLDGRCRGPSPQGFWPAQRD